MNSTLDYLVTFFAEIMRILITIQYANSFFEKRSKRIIPYIISFLTTAISYFMFHNLMINLAATFVGVLLITINYYSDLLKRVIFSVFILAISSVIDMISVFLLRNNPKGNNYDIMSSFLSVGLFLIIALIISSRNHHKDISNFSGKRIILLFFSIVTILTLYIISIDIIVSRRTVIILGLVLLTIDIIIINLYDDMLDKYATEQENNMLREQMKIYENQQRISIENEKIIRGIRHDMKHHYFEIADLAKKNRTTDIIGYIGEMESFINDNYTIQTGVESIDGILNYKLAEAEKKNITCNTHITIPEDLDLSSFDMNIIFGNLMDNAIEASVKVHQPFIGIVIAYKMKSLFIKVENKSIIVPQFKSVDRHITSKKDKINHGYGLENVKRVVEKYSGSMSTSIADNIFTVEIVMFMN